MSTLDRLFLGHLACYDIRRNMARDGETLKDRKVSSFNKEVDKSFINLCRQSTLYWRFQLLGQEFGDLAQASQHRASDQSSRNTPMPPTDRAESLLR